MLNRLIFNLLTRLMAGSWVQACEVQCDAYEDCVTIFFGPIRLEQHECFVLDHQDVAVTLQLGGLAVGYRAVLGEEPIRKAGCFAHWHRASRHLPQSGADIPF
ncbi:MAG: hypothetical protein KDE09_06675 [Anaerolineales bacterium]|nr:hypothetical protein [Anaerolineales bacterium]MCB0007159.1 hypothetical protein [Anaerolineales bacterium]MCB0017459.1 hypothetical protein [Anaerolineales bacterium]MCB0028755.1 hypothetical protein [Anaerolineales bacterium]